MMCNYDVVIPVAVKDTFFIRRVIQYIEVNLEGVDHVYLITSKCNFRILKRQLKENTNCRIIDEDEIVDNLTFSLLKYQLEKYNFSRVGWLFQQFLKMGFCRSKYCNKYYLSWDADTLPLSHLQFFQNGRVMFTRKNEFHKPYFDVIYKLIGLWKTVDYSFIAEHMLFSKEIMEELLFTIEQNSNVSGSCWYEKVINACDFNEPNCFSEFEIYGTYCSVYHPNSYEMQVFNTFRSGALIRGPFISKSLLNQLSFDLDIISFEIWHKPSFPWNIPHFFLRIYIKLIKKLYHK